MIYQREQKKSAQRADDGTGGVHHPLEAERAPIGFGIYRSGEQRLAHRRAHAAPKPGACARQQHLPGVRHKAQGRRADAVTR